MSGLNCCGWDIGGAHLKLVTLAGAGHVLWTRQWLTPLWQGLQSLDAAIMEAQALLADSPVQHAITMTGELVDLFPNRSAGVRTLLERWRSHWPQASAWVYAGGTPLLPLDSPGLDPLAVASRNWHATAALCAGQGQDGLLVDVGSTTTDIIRIEAGRVCHREDSDGGRLASGELVYTGLVRTPVGTLTDRAPWQGRWQGLAQEFFATTADVYRVLGELDEQTDLQPAADGGGKSREHSVRRLARMLGRDADSGTDAEWIALAHYLAGCQRERLREAVMLCASASTDGLPRRIIATGAGRQIAIRLATELDIPGIGLADLNPVPLELKRGVEQCAPAYAVARQLALQASGKEGTGL